MNKDTKFRVEKRKTETEGRDKRNSRAKVHRVLDGVVERKRGSRVIKKRKMMMGGTNRVEPWNLALFAHPLSEVCVSAEKEAYMTTPEP